MVIRKYYTEKVEQEQNSKRKRGNNSPSWVDAMNNNANASFPDDDLNSFFGH